MAEALTVLVTGASRGIGLTLVKHFLDQGHKVIGCSRTAATLNDPNYEHFAVNIASETEVVELFKNIRKEFETLDVVINNAAINPTLSLVPLTSYASASETMATNVLGTFVVCREAAKLMMRKRFGRIINMSSMAVRHEVSGEAIYSASKAAVTTFTRVLAKEVSEYGITCNVVAPSAVPTDMMEKVNKEALANVLKRNAIPGFGKFEDIHQTMDWLIQKQSHAITGQVIYLGGA